jgi:hypothetical protein
MTDKTVNWNSVQVTDKSVKETKEGKEYVTFEIMENKSDKYPKKLSWFTSTDAELASAKAIKKDSYVDVEFTEKEGNWDGKPITYRNIVKMSMSEKQEAKPEAKQSEPA